MNFQQNMINTLILCGLPKSGKTTIGKMVAKKLRWNFIDTDRLIEKDYADKTGRLYSCRQIFEHEGESLFRSLEQSQILSLNSTNSVISLGGGSLDNPKNTDAIKSIGSLIYLKAAPQVLWRRLQKSGIPAYLDPQHPENAFHALAEKRIPLYEAAAQIIIDTSDLTHENVVSEILRYRKP